MAEDKVTNLYNAFINNGYAMEPEAQFRENLRDPKKRKAAYDALVADGYNMEPFADFESNIGFGAPAPPAPAPAPQQQAAPVEEQVEPAPTTVTSGGTPSVVMGAGSATQVFAPDISLDRKEEVYQPVVSVPKVPYREPQREEPPTESQKIGSAVGIYNMLFDFNRKSKERISNLQRMHERMTPEGRELLAAKKMRVASTGAPTRVIGMSAEVLPKSVTQQSQGVEGVETSPQIVTGDSPVPYGVRFVDGKPVTQWLMPDGSLSDDILEADRAEYLARNNRLEQSRMKSAEDAAERRLNETVISLWQEAEAAHKADKEKNAAEEQAVYGGGREMRIVTGAMNRNKDNISHMTRFDLEKMMDKAWESVGTQITDNFYNRLRQQYPDASEEELQANASQMARSLSDNAVYRYAVQQNTPKSTLEYFGRTVADMNVINSISKGLARSQAGSRGDLAAYEAAMGEYGKNHRVAQVTGTVFGMAADPVTLISGGFGSLAGKAALNLGGRFLASRAAGMTTQMGARAFGSSLTGRIIVGSAGAAGNLATYEGLKEAESQWLHGGHVNAKTGEVEGYSAGEILKSTRHGMLMGSFIGPLSPIIGNVADKAVRATTSTIGKVGVRGGEIAVSTLAEGTIFSAYDIVGLRTMSDEEFDKHYADKYGYTNEQDPAKRDEARRNARSSECWDVWDDSMAMMLGFKAQHGIKSAPRVIASLRPIKPTNGRPLTQAERNHNRMSFEERVRKALDPANPINLTRADDERVAQAMRFTADEREELRRAGYGKLADLFSRDQVQEVQRPNIDPAEGPIESRVERVEAETVHRSPEFDGYSAMEELMRDSRVSQAVRAKAYYILTGRMLPMGTVTGYTTYKSEDGRVTISATTANGEIVTTRTFKNEQESMQEVDNIMRQAELNTIDIGERFKESVADEKVLDAAINEVSAIYRAVKAGDKDVTESQVWLAEFLDGAIGRNKDIADMDFVDKYRPEVIREASATIKKIYRAVKAGNKDVTESQVRLVEFLDDAIVRNKDIAAKDRPEAIRAGLEKETGIDVDAALRKMPSKRTDTEQEAVKSYLERLFPEEARQQNAEPTPEQAEAQTRYEQGRLLFGRFEEGDPTAQAEADAIAMRMQEAYQAVEDVFGAEAEYYMFHVNENPWALVNDPELTAEKQDAVLYYINAKAALDGIMDASNESAERKRAEVEMTVAKRTHKDSGVIIPATMKMDNRQVYIVKGEVTMFPDGSAVDVRNSSESLVVMDAQTGEYEFTSRDQIYKVSEAVNPQDELDAALSVIEKEQMSVFGENAVAPEEPVEGAEQQAPDSPAIADNEAYDRGYEQGLENAAKADDAWIANHINILSQNTPESMPDTMKGELDAYLYEQQRRAQSVLETPESVLNPTENAVPSQSEAAGPITEGEIVPEAVSNVENGQQTALSRIPFNEEKRGNLGPAQEKSVKNSTQSDFSI